VNRDVTVDEMKIELEENLFGNHRSEASSKLCIILL
jgi:hypothetical protein